MGMKQPDRRLVRRWAMASVIANIVIVLTGGLVRLTDSGLGCPTWPKCTPTAWTTHEALGIHGAIEFGNRLLTYVLVAVAVGTVVVVWRWSGSTSTLRRITVGLLAGIPFQGVIGGFTVLTHLNPWLVSLHLVLSMVLIATAAALVVLVSDRPAAQVSRIGRVLSAALAVLVAVTVYLGTMVTGSGPHSGDAIAPRNGLNPLAATHLHAAAVYALVAVTVLALVVLRRSGLWRSVWLVAVVEVLQAAIGIAQYENGLPVALVAAHLVGAGLLVAVTAALVTQTRLHPSAT